MLPRVPAGPEGILRVEYVGLFVGVRRLLGIRVALLESFKMGEVLVNLFLRNVWACLDFSLDAFRNILFVIFLLLIFLITQKS